MQLNPAPHIVGVIAWDGTTVTPVDVGNYAQFGLAFRVTTNLAVDAVFTLQSAPASGADSCIPGTWANVAAVNTCNEDVTGDHIFTIPSGTLAGAVIGCGIPCPARFFRLVATSGPTGDVEAVMSMIGPRQ